MAERYPPSATRGLAVGATAIAWPERLGLREAVLTRLDDADRAELISLEGEAYGIHAVMTPNAKGRRYLELCNRGWERLRPHLLRRELLGIGRDPRDAFGHRRPIPPDRWAYATVDFEKWEVRLAGVLIVEVEISWGGLQIHANRRQALFGPVELSLSPRSFDLLLMLAEAAPHMATLDQLKDRLLSKDHGDKALGQAISNLRDSLKDSGVEPGTADGLIENIRGEGYRLKLPPDHIAIITES